MEIKIEKLLNTVETFADSHNLFAICNTIIVGFSGGCDSTFLLWALQKLSSKRKFNLRAVHINHMIRGKQTDEDEEFVRQICEKWCIPLDVHKVNVPKNAGLLSLGIEETARIMRREVFEKEASKYKAVIALGHTANDTVETFVFNLFRGTGVRGLAGIQPRTGIIVRPMLDLWRKEIQASLRELGIPWREDLSNLDMRYSRNKIRHELLPFIEENFNEQSIRHIHKASKILSLTRDALERNLSDKFTEVYLGSIEGVVALRADKALEDEFTFGEVLRKYLLKLGVGLKDFSYEKVSEKFEELLKSDTTQELYGGVNIMRERNCIFIYTKEPFQLKYADISIGNPAKLDAFGKITVSLSNVPSDLHSKDRLVAYIAWNESPISVRPTNFKHMFHPLGGKSVNLAHFIRARKVPRLFRSAVPIVYIGERIAWVAGVEISDKFKIDNSSKKIIRIKWSGKFANTFNRVFRNCTGNDSVSNKQAS